jgi:hypothetical protein
MDGGAMAQNQEVINDASQSYVNYYLGLGASQGIYKDGGAIKNQYEGRTPEDVWDNLTIPQKYHFIEDHLEEIKEVRNIRKLSANDIEKNEWSSLDDDIKRIFTYHVKSGQYASGGSLGKALYVEYSSYFTSNKYDEEKIMSVLESIGAKNIRLENDRGWFNQPEVVVFNGDKNKAQDALNEAFDTDYIRISEKDWRTKKMADGGFTPDVSDGTQFMSGVYANGGSVEDVSGNYYSTTDFVSQNDLMDLAKSTFGQDWESGGDYDYDTEEIKMLVKKLGGGYKILYVDSEQREKFENAKSKYLPLLKNKSNDGDIFVIPNKKMSDGGFTPDVSDGTQFMSGVYANGGSVGDDFQEVIDLGSEQSYTRPYGIVESESNGEVELVAVATIKDLEDYMSEDELPEEGNFQLDITLVPTEQFISEEILESANDEDYSISDDSVLNVVNYAGGLNYSPQERVFFETHQDALDYLMSDELKEQINRDSFSSDYIMYKQYNRLGQTNSEYLDYLMGVTDRFAKGGFVGTVEFNAGDIVWQKDEKRYAFVMNNYGDPINGSDGEIRLDTSGNTMIFTYDPKTYENTGYNLVKLGEKGDTGKFTPKVLAEMKEAGKRYMDSAKSNKGSQQKENIAYIEKVVRRTLDGEFDSFAKPTISSQTTYVPNADVKELSVVVKGELKKLTGSDIVNGVYVKNSAKSASKVDANAVFAKIIKDAKEAKSGKTKRFDASDLKKINLEMVQKLVDAGYTEQQVRNVIFGYAFDNEIIADNELEYDNGIFSYEESYVKEKIDDLVEAQKNKEFVAGIEYPDFDWQGIIKKYKISSKPKEIVIKRNFPSRGYNEYHYEVFVGENIALGHQLGYKEFDSNGKLTGDYIEKGKKVSDITKQNAWQKERGQKAGFNGGYWYVVSSKIETIDDVLKTLLSQKGGYCKELELYSDSFPKTLKENKISFADGGFMADVYAKGGSTDRLSVNKASILSATKKCTDGDSDRSTCQSGNFEVTMVYYYGSLDLDFVYLDYNNPRFNPSKEHYASYSFTKGSKGVLTYFDPTVYNKKGQRTDANTILSKTIEVLKTLGYPVDSVVDSNEEEIENIYAKGGELQGKFLAEIKVPYNFGYVVEDEYEFSRFLSKALTNKFNFGNGAWGVKIVKPLFEKDYSKKIVVEIEIPVGVTQGGGLDKFDVVEFMSKTLTKKWFGNGVWGVDVVKSFADGGFMADVYAKGGATKEFEYVPYAFVYRELDDPDFLPERYSPEEVEEFISDFNNDYGTDYKNWEDFNKGEEYRVFQAIMIKQRKFADGGDIDEEYDDVFVKIYNKYNDKNYFGLKEQTSNALRNWQNALDKGDEHAKKYTKEDVIRIVKENNIADSYNGTYLRLKRAIKTSDKKYLKTRVRYDQKFTKELYEALTGNKLPNTNKEIEVYFESNYADGGSLMGVHDGTAFMQNPVYAESGSYLQDNEGFMRAKNNFNYRYPEMEVYVENLDEPIDLTSDISKPSNKVVIKTIDENIDLNDDNRVRARMTQSNRGSAENFGKINPRAFEFIDLPMPISNKHKND